MATVLIQNIDNIVVKKFKEFAQKQDVKILVLDEKTDDTESHQHKKSLSDVLLAIPKLDSDDVFTRENQEHREIIW